MKSVFFYILKILKIFFLFVLLVSCGSTKPFQGPQPAPPKSEAPYRIGKGDVLEIITWKEQDFSREAPVRIDGRISFPLLEDIQAAGRTTDEIREELGEKLKEFVKHPVVSVAVKAAGSQRFYVMGEIQKTGEYPLIKHLTVLQAFALAGGFTEWAAKKEIILIRKVNGQDHLIKINYKNIVKGEELEKNVLIQADDIIVVP